ncbi:MAG: HAD domain-containing protein [Fimbriimonas sp.]
MANTKIPPRERLLIMRSNFQPDSVLYLDIDGVLNGHEKLANGYCGIRSDCVELLNRLLDDHPGLGIVVSSAWRYLVLAGSMTLDGLENLFLSHGLKCWGRVLGVTVSDADPYAPEAVRGCPLKLRAWQITSDAEALGLPWIALDDLDLPLPPVRFIRTEGHRGVTPSNITACSLAIGASTVAKKG